MQVEIWSDIVCPWCYIGKRRFETALQRFEHASDVEVRWRSFELDPHAPFRRSGSMAEHLAAKYGTTVEQAADRLEQMDRLAEKEGLTYDLAHTQGGNTFAAHRLIHLGYHQDAETGAALKEALLHAYFTELRPVSEPEVLQEIGEKAGLDPDEVAELLAGDRFAGEVRADEAEAAALGCTGVPFFVIDRAFAVPGAQDSDTFLAVLRQAWDRSHTPQQDVDVTAEGFCSGDSCALKIGPDPAAISQNWRITADPAPNARTGLQDRFGLALLLPPGVLGIRGIRSLMSGRGLFGAAERTFSVCRPGRRSEHRWRSPAGRGYVG